MNSIKANVKTGPRITIRKSVFFANVFSASDDSEVNNLIKELKRKDRKAIHIAFAFRIVSNTVTEGMSDDGEPLGTVGLSILTLLRNKNLNNILVAVTRYRGGVKLGPGNLKRAYMNAAKVAQENLTGSNCETHK